MIFNPKLRFVSDVQLADMHQAALDILSKFGVYVMDPEIRDILCDAGCTKKGERVFFSEELILNVVKRQKQEVIMKGRTGKQLCMKFGGFYTHSSGGTTWVTNPMTGEHRIATMEDLIQYIRLMNKLPMLDIPCALCYPSDIPGEITEAVQTATLFEYSTKPIYATISDPINAKYVAELYRLYQGNKKEPPAGMIGICPQSPLHWSSEMTTTLKYLVDTGAPICPLVAPVGGLTSPLTVIGTVTQCHAEILAFATLVYLMNSHAVVIYAPRTFFANMKTAKSILGLPETGISSAIAAQLASYCGFMSDTYGLACTSCAMDEQAGYEKMMNGIVPALAGTTMLTGFGTQSSLNTASVSQLVLDDEMIGMIRRIIRPTEVNDNILGLDVLEAVVTENQNFMAQRHTVKHLRAGEIFNNTIGYNRSLTEYMVENLPELNQFAHERAKELLSIEDSQPLSPELKRETEAIISALKKEVIL